MTIVTVETASGGFRSPYEQFTILKLIIVFGGFFWAMFTIGFALYNYCAIQKPPPAVSFEEALCAENEALMSGNSKRSKKKGSSSKSTASV